ncbi:MAG: 30S ribosomal protein S6 [Kiritimatiellae bacterium]|nr:30S ribosomal protein S6 [Kiritimatiellia bacterium]
MKKYDGMYIFANSAKDEVLDKQIEKVCGEITRLSGKVLNTEVFGKKSFARPMHKRESGVYVKIRFEMDPAQIKTLVARYRLSEEVFRVQVLAVDERRETVLEQQEETHKAREAARAAAAEKAAAAKDSQEV